MVYIFHGVGQRIAYPIARQFPEPETGISEYELPTSFLFQDLKSINAGSGWLQATKKLKAL
jgi:hypothetical protein